jgi:hypothetical protein
VQEVTRSVGLRYDRDALLRIWRLSGKCIDKVKQAIELMLYRHNTSNDVTKPHGFLIDCLKRNWQDGFNIYYEPELPKNLDFIKKRRMEFQLLHSPKICSSLPKETSNSARLMIISKLHSFSCYLKQRLQYYKS